MEVLDSIPVTLDIGEVLKQSRLRKKNASVEETVRELIETAKVVARPKAVYEVAYVENKNGDSLSIGGVRFTSRVLRVNLDKVERVFPYVVTCGVELDGVTVPPDDPVKGFYLDVIKRMVLRAARKHLESYLTRRYALGQMSAMSPGSLEDWPITQQKELFSVFGNVENLIGVTLTESCQMLPLKSVSGIYFPTEVKFESCQLCPREKCIGRRAQYDPELVKKYDLTAQAVVRQ